jgi:hypothetical protein
MKSKSGKVLIRLAKRDRRDTGKSKLAAIRTLIQQMAKDDEESSQEEDLDKSDEGDQDCYLIDPVNCPLVMKVDRDGFFEFVTQTEKHLKDFYQEISQSTKLAPSSIGRYIYTVESFRYRLNQVVVCLEFRLKINYECLCLTKDQMEVERIIKILHTTGEKVNAHPKFIEYGFELMSSHTEAKLPTSDLVCNPILTLFANRFINELVIMVIVLNGAVERILDLIKNNEGFNQYLFHQHPPSREPVIPHLYL